MGGFQEKVYLMGRRKENGEGVKLFFLEASNYLFFIWGEGGYFISLFFLGGVVQICFGGGVSFVFGGEGGHFFFAGRYIFFEGVKHNFFEGRVSIFKASALLAEAFYNSIC